MKKFAALLLSVAMLVMMLCIPAFAEKDPIISPEKPDEPVEPNPPSPVTGCVLGLAGAAAIALSSGGVLVLSAKKARESR